MILQVETCAYSNRLSGVHPGEKTAFSAITMIICLASQGPACPAASLALMSAAVVMAAGIPWRTYIKIFMVPLFFLIPACFAVAVSISPQQDGYLYWISAGGYYAGTTARDLNFAAVVFLKSLGASSCLFFLSLTTPVIDVVSVLRKAGAPALFLELVSLVYRFVFVLGETAGRIYTSQASRLGYSSLRSGYTSAGHLAANLFVIAYRKSQDLFTAMAARGYSGDIRVIEAGHTVSWRNIAIIVFLDLLLVGVSIVSRV